MTTKPSRSSRPKQKKVLLVDDHPIMRQGLAQIVASDKQLSVCCETNTAQRALEMIAECMPDIVLADISLPDKSGLELVKELKARYPKLAVLVVSMHDETLYAERALRAGARGYIMKEEESAKLVHAVQQVLDGQIYLSEQMSAKILDTITGKRSRMGQSPLEQLTDREFEVFEMIGQGKGTREIAQKLGLGIKTVEVHRANIKHKLQVRSAPELIRYAVRWLESQEGLFRKKP